MDLVFTDGIGGLSVVEAVGSAHRLHVFSLIDRVETENGADPVSVSLPPLAEEREFDVSVGLVEERGLEDAVLAAMYASNPLPLEDQPSHPSGALLLLTSSFSLQRIYFADAEAKGLPASGRRVAARMHAAEEGAAESGDSRVLQKLLDEEKRLAMEERELLQSRATAVRLFSEGVGVVWEGPAACLDCDHPFVHRLTRVRWRRPSVLREVQNRRRLRPQRRPPTLEASPLLKVQQARLLCSTERRRLRQNSEPSFQPSPPRRQSRSLQLLRQVRSHDTEDFHFSSSPLEGRLARGRECFSVFDCRDLCLRRFAQAATLRPWTAKRRRANRELCLVRWLGWRLGNPRRKP